MIESLRFISFYLFKFDITISRSVVNAFSLSCSWKPSDTTENYSRTCTVSVQTPVTSSQWHFGSTGTRPRSTGVIQWRESIGSPMSVFLSCTLTACTMQDTDMVNINTHPLTARRALDLEKDTKGTSFKNSSKRGVSQLARNISEMFQLLFHTVIQNVNTFGTLGLIWGFLWHYKQNWLEPISYNGKLHHRKKLIIVGLGAEGMVPWKIHYEPNFHFATDKVRLGFL